MQIVRARGSDLDDSLLQSLEEDVGRTLRVLSSSTRRLGDLVAAAEWQIKEVIVGRERQQVT